MTRAITVAELNGMSAETIRALPDTVPIRDGLTVGVLTPVRGLTSEQVAELFAAADEAAARRTPPATARPATRTGSPAAGCSKPTSGPTTATSPAPAGRPGRTPTSSARWAPSPLSSGSRR